MRDDIAPLEVLDAPVERLEEIDTLWRAVQDLTVDLKMALLLRDVVGLSYTEIADSLEITLATVKWRIYKAREEVQIALVREGVTFGTAAGQAWASPIAPQPGRDFRACCWAFASGGIGRGTADGGAGECRAAAGGGDTATRIAARTTTPARASQRRFFAARRAGADRVGTWRARSAPRRRRAPRRSAAADAGR